MLGDPSRGFLLEHVLTKLLYIDFHRTHHQQRMRAESEHRIQMKQETKIETHMQSDAGHGNGDGTLAAVPRVQRPLAEAAELPSLPPLQIIALSATLPNIEHLCQCLHASFYRQLRSEDRRE
jgi:hypothetical protein